MSRGGVNLKAMYALAILVAMSGCVGVWYCYDGDKEQTFVYDYLASEGRWPDILALAETEEPTDELSKAYHHLALTMTGTLTDRMFDFRQTGTDALLPPMRLDMTSPLAAAEIYYHLGMTSIAERYAYEIQEAIPDFQKSGRMHRRLAETYIAQGDYQLARKTLNTLLDTWAYHDWAEETLALLTDEQAIDNHPVYGRLRRGGLSSDYLYDDSSCPTILRQLALERPDDPLPREYLWAWLLLDRDLQGCIDLLPVFQSTTDTVLPRPIQEALMIAWTSQTNQLTGFPWPISMEVVTHTRDFMTDMVKLSAESLNDKYKGSYFLYFIES